MSSKLIHQTQTRLQRFFRAYGASLDMRIHPLGLKQGYFPVLQVLAREDGISQKALCEQLQIRQPTLSSTLKRMERDGLVELARPREDRRQVLVQLTATARKRLPEAEAALADLRAVMEQGLTMVDLRYFSRILNQMTEQLERDVDDPFLLLVEEVTETD